jgi:hypothetical protein
MKIRLTNQLVAGAMQQSVTVIVAAACALFITRFDVCIVPAQLL